MLWVNYKIVPVINDANQSASLGETRSLQGRPNVTIRAQNVSRRTLKYTSAVYFLDHWTPAPKLRMYERRWLKTVTATPKTVAGKSDYCYCISVWRPNQFLVISPLFSAPAQCELCHDIVIHSTLRQFIALIWSGKYQRCVFWHFIFLFLSLPLRHVL